MDTPEQTIEYKGWKIIVKNSSGQYQRVIAVKPNGKISQDWRANVDAVKLHIDRENEFIPIKTTKTNRKIKSLIKKLNAIRKEIADERELLKKAIGIDKTPRWQKRELDAKNALKNGPKTWEFFTMPSIKRKPHYFKKCAYCGFVTKDVKLLRHHMSLFLKTGTDGNMSNEFYRHKKDDLGPQ
jgi:hypothetical protein